MVSFIDEHRAEYGVESICPQLLIAPSGRTVFWKLGNWLARKYRRGFPRLMRDCVRAPDPGRAKTWVLTGQNSRGWYGEVALRRLVTGRKGQFRWRTPEENPYLIHDENRTLSESRYADIAFAFSNT